MSKRYFISGDGTGVTYGIYEGNMFDNPKLIKKGIKSHKEASKEIEKLEKEDKQNVK